MPPKKEAGGIWQRGLQKAKAASDSTSFLGSIIHFLGGAKVVGKPLKCKK